MMKLQITLLGLLILMHSARSAGFENKVAGEDISLDFEYSALQLKTKSDSDEGDMVIIELGLNEAEGTTSYFAEFYWNKTAIYIGGCMSEGTFTSFDSDALESVDWALDYTWTFYQTSDALIIDWGTTRLLNYAWAGTGAEGDSCVDTYKDFAQLFKFSEADKLSDQYTSIGYCDGSVDSYSPNVTDGTADSLDTLVGYPVTDGYELYVTCEDGTIVTVLDIDIGTGSILLKCDVGTSAVVSFTDYESGEAGEICTVSSGSDDDDSTESTGSNTAVIAGCAVGGLLLVVLLTTAFILYKRDHNKIGNCFQRPEMNARESSILKTTVVDIQSPTSTKRYVPPELPAGQTHVFLTHDWGQEQGHDNHARVSFVNEELKRRGYKTWFDSDKMTGHVVDHMSRGIDNTRVVVIFITERYCKKVGGTNDNDFCKLEFNYALLRKKISHMLPVVMETRMKHTTTWEGALGMALGGNIYVDFTGDREQNLNSFHVLEKEIAERLRLLD